MTEAEDALYDSMLIAHETANDLRLELAAKDARIAKLEAIIKGALSDFQEALIKAEAQGAEITNLKGLLTEVTPYLNPLLLAGELEDATLPGRIGSALKEGKYAVEWLINGERKKIFRNATKEQAEAKMRESPLEYQARVVPDPEPWSVEGNGDAK